MIQFFNVGTREDHTRRFFPARSPAADPAASLAVS
jgi:hypothetical protein